MLPDGPATLQAMPVAERAESERLRRIIEELQRHRFGRGAENLSEDQLLLGWEEAEQAETADAPAVEKTAPVKRK